MVKVCIIGAGGEANLVHYPSLTKMENVEIVGICDLNQERLRQTSEKYKISNIYTDYKKMLEEKNPDAVYIIVPPHYLYDIVMPCLDRGFNIFTEKPLGMTAEQARQMAKLAERKGVLTMVGFNRRFAPLIVEGKKRIKERGEVVLAEARFFQNYLDRPLDYNGAIDVLTYFVIHSVDLLRYIGGEVKQVKSMVKGVFADYNNIFCALFEFSSGAIGTLSADWASGKRVCSIAIHGKGIAAFIEHEKQAIIYSDGKEDGECIDVKEFTGKKEFFEIAGFLDEHKYFIECMEKKELPETNFSDAVKTMELIERIYRNTI
ncbi:MAG TPA: Gfo/Idh/MocA family oxidoreductase [bacterium]|nr:Gfo/Idh/MocA family oxidoreductase [bacterium]